MYHVSKVVDVCPGKVVAVIDIPDTPPCEHLLLRNGSDIEVIGASAAGQNIELPVNNLQHTQAENCVCKYCKDTGYLSALGESVQANEYSPGWKYCPYCSRKLSAVR